MLKSQFKLLEPPILYSHSHDGMTIHLLCTNHTMKIDFKDLKMATLVVGVLVSLDLETVAIAVDAVLVVFFVLAVAYVSFVMIS